MKIKVWGPAFALLGLILIAGGGLFSQQSKPNNYVQLPKVEQQHSTANNTAKPPAEEGDDGGDEEGRWYDTFLEHTPDWFVALFTLLLTAVTWRLVVSTNKLWAAGERQYRLTRSIALNQQRQITESNQIARDAAERQLRAYVTVNGVIRTRDPGDLDSHGFAVMLDVKNDGQTPAYNLLQWANVAIREFPLTSRLPIHCLENPTRVVLPREAKNLAFPAFSRALTVIEENAIIANHTAIYVFGEIDYVDAFGKQHLTQFRFRCNGQGYALGMFKADGEGNNAD